MCIRDSTCAALPSATCGSWTQLAGCGWNGPGAQVRAQERKLLTIDVDSTICETFARVRQAGARGPVTLRADSGFYSKKVLLACRRAGVRFSVTVRQDQAAQRMIPAIPETCLLYTSTPAQSCRKLAPDAPVGSESRPPRVVARTRPGETSLPSAGTLETAARVPGV